MVSIFPKPYKSPNRLFSKGKYIIIALKMPIARVNLTTK